VFVSPDNSRAWEQLTDQGNEQEQGIAGDSAVTAATNWLEGH